MNQYPVIFLTLKNIEGLDFQSAYETLESLTAELCIKYSFLLESGHVDPSDKNTFQKLKAQEAKPQDLKQNYYNEMLDMIRSLLGAVKNILKLLYTKTKPGDKKRSPGLFYFTISKCSSQKSIHL